MLWAWPDDVASSAFAPCNPHAIALPTPRHIADNHSKLHKCMTNKCEANERSSRQPPGAASSVDADADADAGHRYWQRHTMYALGHDTYTYPETLYTIQHTYTPACCCKLKMETSIVSHSNANGE